MKPFLFCKKEKACEKKKQIEKRKALGKEKMKKGMSDFTVLLILISVLILSAVVYFIIKRGLENVLR